ncbi:hypothetical protein LVD15_25935 [Fulvivirga maritima]|uniref:helix-turn-helix and ligand-binding sensor domain-containing protein n=1 Tax=Fulvivirga maritima TaxID=2904247 RepID=UPI001F1F0E76|nr:triple tyrosine motif-containing protein [Fulvivirga maritima]UII26694.1 hypothetical protein LVD15_25935 [Fulvivirga maritima]
MLSTTLKYRIALLFILLVLIFSPTEAQELASEIAGKPGIVHYTQKEFKADQQFWAVCEDNNGILYFGNNDGAIIFDGETWHKVSIPNNSSIRCLAADSLGNVYAGAFNEFGLIKKDETGNYYYQSLFDTLKFNDSKIENLWEVHILKSTVIFRSFGKLIAISGNKVTQLPSRSYFVKSFVVNNNYYVHDLNEGIFRLNLENMQLQQCLTFAQIKQEELIALLPITNSEEVLGISKTGKVFNLDLTKGTSTFSHQIFDKGTNQVESAIVGKDGFYYLATLSEGILKMDQKGLILNKSDYLPTLQDRSVINLYQTRQGNLWALLNRGLDYITFNSPISAIFEGANIYDVIINNSEMYLATNQGIFYSDSINIKKPIFTQIPGTEGQAWSIDKRSGDILASHDKGIFILNHGNATKVGEETGIWKTIATQENENLFLAATYNGLLVIEKKNGHWTYKNRIKGFDESTRDILETETPGTYWVCHGFKGVFKIKMDPGYTRVTSVEHFTTQNGFTYPYSINVTKWQDQIVFTTDEGIFTYNQNNNQFEPYQPLNSILDSTYNTRTLIEHEDKTWFIQDDEAGYFVTKSPDQFEKGYFLKFKGDFNRGMECILPISQDQVMLGTKRGLYLFDLTYKDRAQEAHTMITSAQYYKGETQKSLTLNGDSRVVLPNGTNTLRFDFAVPQMQNDADIQYSYKLEEVDKKWSDWDLASYKEYAHLMPGKYTFKVKSRSLIGTRGDVASISFEILPLWYQTIWAAIAYFLIAAGLAAFIIQWVKKKIAKENAKTRAEEQQAKKLLELEVDQLKLKAEKDKINRDKVILQENIIHKSKELANYTMLLVKKKEIFSEIQEDIKTLRSQVKTEGSRKKLQSMYAKLNDHVIGVEYMNVFESNFEKVHHDFFANLKAKYPDLTQRELRLCAFIKMNLTNKEISPLLNISVRGVETARYRIRKKLHLEHDSNFTEFLESVAVS